jgi:hypothetical protein
MEMQFQWGERTVIFAIDPGLLSTTEHARPSHPDNDHAGAPTTGAHVVVAFSTIAVVLQPEPHDVCSPAAIFDHVHQAVLEVPELHAIATAIIGGTTAPAWSLDQGLLFFDGCFYLLLASPLLPDQLETLLVVG